MFIGQLICNLNTRINPRDAAVGSSAERDPVHTATVAEVLRAPDYNGLENEKAIETPVSKKMHTWYQPEGRE